MIEVVHDAPAGQTDATGCRVSGGGAAGPLDSLSEVEADAFAQRLVTQAFGAPPYYEDAAGPAGSLSIRANQVTQGADALVAWSAELKCP